MTSRPQRIGPAELTALERRSRALVRSIEIALILAALSALLVVLAATLSSPALVTLAAIAGVLAIAALVLGIRAAVHPQPERPAAVRPPKHA